MAAGGWEGSEITSLKIKESGTIISLPPLQKAIMVYRLNRFVAEIDTGEEVARAHVPSSGRMKELLFPGAAVYVARNTRTGRKTSYRILLAEYRGVLVSIDSLLPNRLTRRALLDGRIAELRGYEYIRPEARYRNSRFDFYLSGPAGECYLEVKSVTLVDNGVALFPDAPSARGARHLEELASAAREGKRAAVLFVIQRVDADCFRPNDTADPVFGAALRRAADAGVEVMALKCVVEKTKVILDKRIPVLISH